MQSVYDERLREIDFEESERLLIQRDEEEKHRALKVVFPAKLALLRQLAEWASGEYPTAFTWSGFQYTQSFHTWTVTMKLLSGDWLFGIASEDDALFFRADQRLDENDRLHQQWVAELYVRPLLFELAKFCAEEGLVLPEVSYNRPLD